MTSSELLHLLTVAGWRCRIQRGDEVAFEVCYFCGNPKWNLEVSAARGLYHCWNCRKGGRADELLHTLTGEKYEIVVDYQARRTGGRPTAPTMDAIEFTSVPAGAQLSSARYLAERGISAAVATQYGMVVCTDAKHRLYGRIAIPVREYWTEAVVGWVGRTYTGAKPKYLSTLPQQMITGWRANDVHAPTVVVEGPLDGVMVHRSGYNAAVLSGVGGAGLVEWASRVPPRVRIVVMLDGEAIQQAQRLYWGITPVRPPDSVVLACLDPQQDPANLGVEGVRSTVRRALSIPGPTV